MTSEVQRALAVASIFGAPRHLAEPANWASTITQVLQLQLIRTMQRTVESQPLGRVAWGEIHDSFFLQRVRKMDYLRLVLSDENRA